MTKPIPSYLRLITDTTLQTPAPASDDLTDIVELCRAYSEATGWRLQCVAPSSEKPADAEPELGAQANLMWSAPVDPGVGTSPGHIRLFKAPAGRSGGARPRLGLDRATRLAESISRLWNELVLTRRALRDREAELTTGVPLVLDADEARTLGRRLQGVLQGGAEAIGCQAAALYLLDSATSELKLRVSWGLPERRFAAPARPLRGSLADLEALLGHAVVLSDPALHDHWRVPEPSFAACICVPVASANMPLGTLWLFAHERRDFSDAQSAIAEVVAGRLAAELERQLLADEARRARGVSAKLTVVDEAQRLSVPNTPPQIEGWQMAGKVCGGGTASSLFYDWCAGSGESLAVMAGGANEGGMAGSLAAAVCQGAARALAVQSSDAPRTLLDGVNSIAWSTSAGEQRCGMFHAVLAPKADSICWSATGPLTVLQLGRAKSERRKFTQAALGEAEALHAEDRTARMAYGEVLLVYATSSKPGALSDSSTTKPQATKGTNSDAANEQLALALTPSLDLPASRLADIAAQILAQSQPAGGEQMVLVIKRRH